MEAAKVGICARRMERDGVIIGGSFNGAIPIDGVADIDRLSGGHKCETKARPTVTVKVIVVVSELAIEAEERSRLTVSR